VTLDHFSNGYPVVVFRDVANFRSFADEKEARDYIAEHGLTVEPIHRPQSRWSWTVQWVADEEPRTVSIRELRAPWAVAAPYVAAKAVADAEAVRVREEREALDRATRAAELADHQRVSALREDARAAVRARFGLAPHDHRANVSGDGAGTFLGSLSLRIDDLDALAAGLDDPEQVDWYAVLDLPRPAPSSAPGAGWATS
jgi:hypothetical protein